MVSPLVFEAPAFLLGLLFGSFLNVCISRMPYHESVVKPRSRCPRCTTPIRWYDNIPLLSFILLRTRCRSCKATIPWRYPLVELGTGIWFFYAVHQAHFAYIAGTMPSDFSIGIPRCLALLVLGFLLIGLMVMDWQTHTLPDAFTLTGTGIGFALVCVQAVFLGPHQDELILHGRNPLSSPGQVVDAGNVVLTGPEHLVLGRLLAIVIAASIILIFRGFYKLVRKREGMGLGDAKLMAMIAAFLGFWPAMIAMFVGVIACAFYAVLLLARRKADAATAIPLGTFLCIGGLFAAVWGYPLVNWYSSLLR